MTRIIFITSVGVFFLGVIPLFVIWINKRSKKRAAKKFDDRFRYLDDYYNYYNELEDSFRK